MAHYEITQRKYPYKSVRMYDHDPDNYEASFQIEDDGFIHSLSGPGFYRLFVQFGPQIFRDLEIKSAYCDIRSSHFRLMKFKLRRDFIVTDMGPIIDSGRDMKWVKITIKSEKCLL